MSQESFSQTQRKAAFEHNLSFSPNIRLFASGENLAKLAYDLTPMWQKGVFPQVVTHLDRDGQWKDYTPYALEVDTKGLHGFVLVPNDPSSVKEVKVTFRGTMDTASLYRDFEGHGPGAHSMLHEKDHLIRQIHQIVNSHYGDDAKGLRLCIAGHSLGASDAENLAAHLTHAMAHHGALKWMEHLEVFSFNSPGIPHAIADRSVKDARKVLKDRDFTFEMHYGKSEHDAVQRLGESHVFHGLTSDEIKTDLIEMDKDIEYAQEIEQYFHHEKMPLTAIAANLLVTLIYAHKLTTFFTPDEEGKIHYKHNGYKYLNNQNPKEAREIEEELSDKAHTMLQVYKYILSYFIDDIAHLLESANMQKKLVNEASAPMQQHPPKSITMGFDKKRCEQPPFILQEENQENLAPKGRRLKV